MSSVGPGLDVLDRTSCGKKLYVRIYIEKAIKCKRENKMPRLKMKIKPYPNRSTSNHHIESVSPITAALARLLNEKVQDDPYDRTYAELIAESVVCQAIKGNLEAAKEITDRVEGTPSIAPNHRLSRPARYIITYAEPLPKFEGEEVPSPQQKTDHILPNGEDPATNVDEENLKPKV
jgi:hypothetical protein